MKDLALDTPLWVYLLGLVCVLSAAAAVGALLALALFRGPRRPGGRR